MTYFSIRIASVYSFSTNIEKLDQIIEDIDFIENTTATFYPQMLVNVVFTTVGLFLFVQIYRTVILTNL